MFNTFRFHQTIYNTSYQLALASCWRWPDKICGSFFLPSAGKWLWTSPADLARKVERVRHRKAHGGGNLGRNGIRPGECLTSFNVSRSQFACGPKVDSDEFALLRRSSSISAWMGSFDVSFTWNTARAITYLVMRGRDFVQSHNLQSVRSCHFSQSWHSQRPPAAG